MAGGRPSLYKPEYCELVVKFMRKGNLIQEFAAKIDVSRDTLDEWRKVHPEFSDAMKRATEACAAWWIKTIKKERKLKASDRTPALTLYLLNNVVRIPEVRRVELTGANGSPIMFQHGELTDEQLERNIRAAIGGDVPGTPETPQSQEETP